MVQVLGIASGKGGVGKTTITAGLSAALANREKRVLAIDCDSGMRNLDLLLGLENKSLFNADDVLLGRKRLSDCLIRHPDFGALYFLPAGISPDNELITAERLTTLIMRTQNAFDYVLLDCPAGAGKVHREIAKVCDTLLVVTTPDFSAIRDADKAAQIMVTRRQRLIINRVVPSLIKNGTLSNIDEIIDATAIQLIGLIPDDPAVAVMTNSGEPVCDKTSKAGIAISNIAARLDGQHKPLQKFW